MVTQALGRGSAPPQPVGPPAGLWEGDGRGQQGSLGSGGAEHRWYPCPGVEGHARSPGRGGGGSDRNVPRGPSPSSLLSPSCVCRVRAVVSMHTQEQVWASLLAHDAAASPYPWGRGPAQTFSSHRPPSIKETSLAVPLQGSPNLSLQERSPFPEPGSSPLGVSPASALPPPWHLSRGHL